MGVLTLFTLSYGSDNTFGIVVDDDFYKAGVKRENLEKAKLIMESTTREFKKLSLDKQKLEIDINQLLLDGPEKNLTKLDNIFDELGRIEASVYKKKIRSQLEMYKYISKEEYMKARNFAIERIQEQQKKELEKSSGTQSTPVAK